MMLYMAANNSRVWKYRASGYPMGWMISPAGGGGWRNTVRGEVVMPYAIDNGMYHAPDKPPKGESALPPFYALLQRFIQDDNQPVFVVSPDVPYDGAKTKLLSAKHYEIIRATGYTGRIAIAVQNGMTPDDLDGYEAVFVAGSTEWKWATASGWMDEARARGMWGHVARVNTIKRVRQCIDMGADSADGTGIWRGDRKQLGGVLEALWESHLFIAP